MDVLERDQVLEFEGFRLDKRGGGLFRLTADGPPVPVPIGSRALDILQILAERQGELVPKQDIMAAAWPGTTVEENNLTMQISALRRVLDQGRKTSCIQTVSGRGYRFLPAVGRVERTPDGLLCVTDAAEASSQSPQPAANARHATARLSRTIIAALAILGLLLAVLIRWPPSGPSHPAPPLSLVVMPFQNLGGDPKDDYLAEGITDDLTSDLSQVNGTFVISHASAQAYKGKTISAVQAGRELGVRYIVDGSVRRFGSMLRVNVQLTAADTGASLWSDRFDEDISQLVEGQERIVSRMRASLGIEVVDIENLRRHRDRNTRPDAFDLILQAQAICNQPTNRQRQAEARALYEQALQLDPKSVPAMMGVFVSLFDERLDLGYWLDWSDHGRMVKLIEDARAIAPYDIAVLAREASLYEVEGRYQDAMATAERAIEAYPNNIGGYLFLARSKIFTGHADEAIPLLAKVIRLNPRDPWLWDRYWRMGYALLLVGRYQESIPWQQRALAVYPDAAPALRTKRYRMMAAAHALSGQLDEARRNMAEAVRIWPFHTVRSEFPMDPTSASYAAQIRRYQEGLRIAGLRDHAEEDADFGVAPDAVLHASPVGYTPATAPGARTIRTADLVKLIASEKPLVLDTVTYSWGRSVPGAIGLRDSGVGGLLTGGFQDHLRAIMTKLTAGDLSRPIVAMGWNSERFDGRNLSLRLTALGYTNVWWYRGGREAWEVNNLPETPLTMIDWTAGPVSHQ